MSSRMRGHGRLTRPLLALLAMGTMHPMHLVHPMHPIQPPPAHAQGDRLPVAPLRCPGCAFGAALRAGYDRGVRVTVTPGFERIVLPFWVHLPGYSGACLQTRHCWPHLDCGMGTVAAIQNDGDQDLWVQTDDWWLQVPGLGRPDADGWLRIPRHGSALYAAGFWPLACSGVPLSRAIEVRTAKQGGLVAVRIDWLAVCSRCHDK